jgi:hypothetical protein
MDLPLKYVLGNATLECHKELNDPYSSINQEE